MGSENLSDSTSFAGDDCYGPVPNGEQEGCTEEVQKSRRGLFRSVISWIENRTGWALTKETKRKIRLSATRNFDFVYNITRKSAFEQEVMPVAVPVSEEDVKVTSAIDDFINDPLSGSLEVVEPADAEVLTATEPEEILDAEVPVEAEVVAEEIGAPAEVPAEPAPVLEVPEVALEGIAAEDELDSIHDIQVATEEGISDIAVESDESSDDFIEVSIRPEFASVETSTMISEQSAVALPAFEEVDDFDYDALYTEISVYVIIHEVMHDIVPEVFSLDYGKYVPEYVISEISEPIEASTVVEVPEEIDDGVDFEELYEDLSAEIIVNEVMEAIVPEVFDPNYGKYVPEYVISEIGDAQEDSTVISVPESPSETCEPCLPEVVSTSTTFTFAFATTGSRGKTGFSFAFGPMPKKEADIDDVDTGSNTKMGHTDATVFAASVSSGKFN